MPNRFSFRLERLLRLRELAEQVRLKELGGALAEKGRAERAVSQSRRDEADSEDGLSVLCGEGPLALSDIKDAWIDLERARRGTIKAGVDLAQKTQKESAAREAYAAAGRDRTVLSQLRQRKELEHLREYDRWEQKLLDEAGARRRS